MHVRLFFLNCFWPSALALPSPAAFCLPFQPPLCAFSSAASGFLLLLPLLSASFVLLASCLVGLLFISVLKLLITLSTIHRVLPVLQTMPLLLLLFAPSCCRLVGLAIAVIAILNITLMMLTVHATTVIQAVIATVLMLSSSRALMVIVPIAIAAITQAIVATITPHIFLFLRLFPLQSLLQVNSC